MNWLYWNYIINSLNYIKKNWNHIKENWNSLEKENKRCVYIILFLFSNIIFLPYVPKIYSILRARILRIISLIMLIKIRPYYPDGHLSILNNILH